MLGTEAGEKNQGANLGLQNTKLQSPNETLHPPIALLSLGIQKRQSFNALYFDYEDDFDLYGPSEELLRALHKLNTHLQHFDFSASASPMQILTLCEMI